MRGLVAGLSSPHPMATGLPAIYQEDDPFTVRFTQAFDDSLAPIFSTLDNLPAYFDPRYAPEDFLGWLAGWVAIELDETWEVERRRRAVRDGADLLRRRGTAGGLAAEIELATGGQVEIVENGGSGWSLDAGSPIRRGSTRSGWSGSSTRRSRPTCRIGSRSWGRSRRRPSARRRRVLTPTPLARDPARARRIRSSDAPTPGFRTLDEPMRRFRGL